MKEKIMEIFDSMRDNPIDLETLYKKCGYTNYSYEDFLSLINELLSEQCIICSNSRMNLYKLNPYHEGIFRIKRNGDCYVLVGDRQISINKDFSYGAMDKDKVLVKITNYDNNTGTIKEIVERSGILAEVKTVNNDRYALVGKSMYKIELPTNLVDGMIIKIKIDSKKAGKYFHATLDSIVGHKNSTGIEEKKILAMQGIPFEFSQKTLEEVDEIPSSVDTKDIDGRHDLRDKMIFTIDGDDTKDIDDAISIEKLENDNYKLGVHIADVSHYVLENSNIDKDARERATSVYMPGVVNPMYPVALSNGICSLNPNVDRLAITCEMVFDSNGKLIDFDIFKSVINSRKQMTYKNVNKILNENIIPEGYNEFADKIYLMNELSNILRNSRNKRGMINFDSPEVKIIMEDGKVKSIEKRIQDTGETLIENFMLAANECVATYVYNMGINFVYRVHDLPSEEKLKRVINIIKSYGEDTNVKLNVLNPHFVQKLLEEIKDSKNYEVFSDMILRCMAKAKYQIENGGHFGIAVDADKGEAYTHFTSPIRRYPDTTVHRVLTEILNGNYGKITSDDYKSNLKSIAEHSSVNEKKADQCEREADKMRMAEYMSDYINSQYLAKIVGFTYNGMFVRLENLVEGRVGFNTMDDFYNYDDEMEIIVGQKKGKVYRLGDEIPVKLVKADSETREIDFEIVKTKVRKIDNNGNHK